MLEMMFNIKEVTEYLIRKQIDGPMRAMRDLMGRPPREQDFKTMDDSIEKMYDGWVRMNGNIRQLYPFPEDK